MTILREDFLWGASTAAHQIEGNNLASDFWAAENAAGPGNPMFQERSGDACDSYHRYREDVRLAAEGGLNAYRFSIEWARIEPVKGRFSRAELLHYRDMIDACHEHGLTPLVTLHHFTSPAWLAAEGGIAGPRTPGLFARYVDCVSEILHDVPWIITINEPNILALFGLMTLAAQDAEHSRQAAGDGIARPAGDDEKDDGPGNGDGVGDGDGAETGGDDGPADARPALPAPPPEMAAPIIAMHEAARKVLRDRVPGARIGWSPAGQAFTPTPGNEAIWERVFHQWEGVYLDACEQDDFIGVQSYTSQPVDADGPVPHPDSPDNTLTGWAYRPDALAINLRRYWERYRKPMVVTENGIATADDARRIAYTREALRGLVAAAADGVDVRGYCHWSLLDNYEWGRWEPTFGLIAVDRAHDFERAPKPSLAWLGGVAAENAASLEPQA